MHVQYFHNYFQRIDYDEGPIDEESKARLPSLKLIQVLKAMSQAKNDLNKVTGQH